LRKVDDIMADEKCFAEKYFSIARIVVLLCLCNHGFDSKYIFRHFPAKKEMALFRPCIDLHNGKVKQIVGGTLTADGDCRTNFVAQHGAGYFATLYRNVRGMLPKDCSYFTGLKKTILPVTAQPAGRARD
jgi:hypothetical protein